MSKRKKVVEEKVKKRKRVRVLAMLFHFIMGLVIVGLAAFLIIVFFFHVEDVKFKGNTVLSNGELADYLFDDKYSENAVYCLGKNLVFPRKDIPFVESVSMKLKDRNTLVVTVKEKEFLGRVLDADGNWVYFDDSTVIGEVSTVSLDGLLEVTMEDVDFSKLSAGEKLPLKSKRKKELLKLINGLQEEDISVSAIHFYADGSITMDYNGILINFGTSSNLDAKVIRLKYILPQIADQAGTLHLEDWSEGNRDIVFEKAG